MPIKLVVNVTQLKCVCRKTVSPFLLLCWSKAPATARPINGKTEAALNVRINSPLSPMTFNPKPNWTYIHFKRDQWSMPT